MTSPIEDRLRMRLLDQAKFPDELFVTDDEWQEIVELYKQRGHGEPKVPVIMSVPIRIKHD